MAAPPLSFDRDRALFAGIEPMGTGCTSAATAPGVSLKTAALVSPHQRVREAGDQFDQIDLPARAGLLEQMMQMGPYCPLADA